MTRSSKIVCLTLAAIATFSATAAFAQMTSPYADNSTLLYKLDELQRELQQLRGQVEVQENDLRALRKQQEAFYHDLDKRLGDLRDGSANVMDLNVSASASANEQASSESAAAAEGKAPVVVAATTSSSTGEKASAKAPQNRDPVAEQASYAAAYELVRAQDYDRAIDAMQRFLSDYPDSQYAANARYWLGELYLAQQQHEQAVTEFLVVINNFADSPKVPDAMLKLGFVYQHQGNNEKARQLYSQLQENYPDTNSARIASTRLPLPS